jgi:hypothetical protein
VPFRSRGYSRDNVQPDQLTLVGFVVSRLADPCWVQPHLS